MMEHPQIKEHLLKLQLKLFSQEKVLPLDYTHSVLPLLVPAGRNLKDEEDKLNRRNKLKNVVFRVIMNNR